MKKPDQANHDLIAEISSLRQRIEELEKSEMECKRAQEALRESEEKYRILLSESPDPTFSFTPEGQYRYVNKAFALGVGKPVEYIIGRTIWDVFPKEEADKRFAPLSQVFRTGVEKVIEVRVPRADGDRYYVTTITPIKNLKGETISAICSSKDISERKRTEEALRVSEERFKSIVSTSQEWIWATDTEGRHIFSNPAVLTILGYHPDEIIGQSALHLLHKEDAPKVKDLLTRSIEQKTGWPNLVFRWQHKDGTYRYLESNAVPVFDNTGALKGFQGSDRDITERKRMENELSESEEQLRVLSESIADGMVYQVNSGKDGRQRVFSYLSPKVEAFHGLKAKDVKRNPSLIYDQVQEPYRAILAEAEARAFETMSKLEIDVPVQLPAGDVHWRRFISSPRSHSDGSIIWDGIELDITRQRQAEEERLRLQQRLQHAEKMEAIGTLAGGVAHDLNNVLGILVGYSELLLSNIPEGSPLRNHVEKMMKGGVRAAAIVQDLLTLARRGVHAEGVVSS